MMKSFRHLRSTVFQLQFLLLFAIHYTGIRFFPHTHIVDNQLIVHSHPLSSATDHEHTSAELSLINILSHLQAFSSINGLRSLLPLTDGFVFVSFPFIESVSCYFRHSFFLRPPPVK